MFGIKVVDRYGYEMWVRRGDVRGQGPVCRYATRQPAERDAQIVRELAGDEFQSINVVVMRGNPT